MRKRGPQKAGTGVKLRDLRRNLANFNRRDEKEQIWPRLWRQKKRRWQRMWGAPRWSQRSWRKMKRIVIKRERGKKKSRGHLERLHIAGVPTHSGRKGKLFRKRDNRPTTKTLRDCSQWENVHRENKKQRKKEAAGLPAIAGNSFSLRNIVLDGWILCF